MNTSVQIKPEVGMGGTMGVGSDCYSYTVVKVISDKKILCSPDDPGKNLSTWPDQNYNITPNMSTDHAKLFTLRKDGHWHEGTKLSGCKLHLGHRSYYQDPSF